MKRNFDLFCENTNYHREIVHCSKELILNNHSQVCVLYKKSS